MAVDPRHESAMKVFEASKSIYELIINLGARSFLVWITSTVILMLFIDTPASENFRAWMWLGWCFISAAFIVANFWLKRSEEETKREVIRSGDSNPPA